MRWYQDRLFPKLLDWATRPLYRDRQRLLQGARGRVLELGIGTGANLALYGDTVSEIHGLEPEAAMLALARRHARDAGIRQPLHLLRGDARRLPYPDGHFDTVVACLVFCTIPEPELAAREMHRVLAPGGRLLLLEHIASGRPRTFRWQRRVDPLWHHLACGCHPPRPTPDTLRDAGFDLSDTRVFRHRKLPGLMAELLQGSARRAD